MKINEVIVEAVNTSTGTPNPDYQNDEVHVDPKTGEADFSGIKQAWQGAKMLGRGAASLPGRIKGAVAGYQASQQQRAGQEEVQQLVKPWIKSWNQTIGRSPELKNNPQALHDFAVQMTKGRIKDLPMPTDTSFSTVEKYLSDAIGKYLNNYAGPVTPTPGPTQPLTRAQQIKQSRAMRATANPAPAAPVATAEPELAPGLSVTSPEPIMFKFQGQNVGLGTRGQWVNTKTRKPVDEPMQAFFTQQHDKFLGVGK